MRDLIKITENEKGTRVVDARELWEGLESKRRFADLLKVKVVENMFFAENLDWGVIHNSVKNPIGGRPTKDYSLTIDTAKKVAMSEQTQKGDEVRDYFLQCEKALQERSVLPSNYISALKQLIVSEEAKEALLIENNEMKPKAAFFDEVTGSRDAIELSQVAKVLAVNGYGRNRLFKFLREKGALRDNNMPYQSGIDSGYFRVIEQKYTKPDGSTHINIKTLVHQKGVNYISKLLKKESL